MLDTNIVNTTFQVNMLKDFSFFYLSVVLLRRTSVCLSRSLSLVENHLRQSSYLEQSRYQSESSPRHSLRSPPFHSTGTCRTNQVTVTNHQSNPWKDYFIVHQSQSSPLGSHPMRVLPTHIVQAVTNYSPPSFLRRLNSERKEKINNPQVVGDSWCVSVRSWDS